MFSCSFFLFFHLFQGVLNSLMPLRSLCGRRVLCGKIQGYSDFTRKFDRAAVHIRVLMCRASSIVIISNTLTVSFPYRNFGGISGNVLRTYEVRRRWIWAERSAAVCPLLDDPLGQNCIAILSARSPSLLFPADVYSVSEIFKNSKNASMGNAYFLYPLSDSWALKAQGEKFTPCPQVVSRVHLSNFTSPLT